MKYKISWALQTSGIWSRTICGKIIKKKYILVIKSNGKSSDMQQHIKDVSKKAHMGFTATNLPTSNVQ